MSVLIVGSVVLPWLALFGLALMVTERHERRLAAHRPATEHPPTHVRLVRD